MKQKSPRVLVVGQVFNLSSGMGITLTNLFKRFNRDSLGAIAQCNVAKTNDMSLCPSVYCIGQDLKNPRRSTVSFITKILKKITGLNMVTGEFAIDTNLDNWIKKFRPEIIYSQLASISTMKMVYAISKKYNLPLVIHMVDDWPKVINNPNFLYFYWQKKIDKELKKLISQASALLVISEEMKIEYDKKYHKKFEVFHNPIDLSVWKNFIKDNWKIDSVVKIIYVGSINISNNRALLEIAKNIDRINHKETKIILDIYSFQYKQSVAKHLVGHNGVNLLSPVEYQEIPKTISGYDFNLLPLNLKGRSADFTKLSMPTKASECMISGVPTIVHASDKSALAKHAKKYGWAEVISSRNNFKLQLTTLINEENRRKDIAQKAIKFASNNYDINEVSQEFEAKIKEALR